MKNNTVGFFVIIVLLSVTSIFSFNLLLRQRSSQDKLDIRTFPYKIGQWEGRDLGITEREYEILETRNLILREYVNSSGEKLSLFIVYSETNRSVFHPPEVCLLGSGVKILDKKIEKIDFGKYKFSANKLYTKKDNYRGIALYSYKAGNLYTDNFYLQQFYFAINQLFGRHKGGATVRVSMALKQDEQESLKTIKTFLKNTIKIIDTL